MNDTAEDGLCKGLPLGSTEFGRAKLKRSALQLQKLDLMVHPVHGIEETSWRCTCAWGGRCEDKGKHPHLVGYPQEASKRPDMVEKWWSKWPRANIGVATGRLSGVFVIDVDGPDGEESLRQAQIEYGWLPETWEVKTKHGRHIYFQYPPEGVELPGTRGFMRGIDLRSNGNYVVAPGSQHWDDHVYHWITGHSPKDIDRPATLPEAWIAFLTGKRTGSVEHPHRARFKAKGLKLKWDWESDVLKGTRNLTMFDLACHLRDRFFTEKQAKTLCDSLNQTHFKPPLTSHRVATQVKSAFTYKRRPSKNPGIHLGDGASRVKAYLLKVRESRGTEWISPTQLEIAKAVGLRSDRAVRNAIDKLADFGLLETRTSGRRKQYRLLIPEEHRKPVYSPLASFPDLACERSEQVNAPESPKLTVIT